MSVVLDTGDDSHIDDVDQNENLRYSEELQRLSWDGVS
jgi:hypothetical protein